MEGAIFFSNADFFSRFQKALVFAAVVVCTERGTQTEEDGGTGSILRSFTSVEIQRHQVSRSATGRAKAGGMKEVTHRYEKITPESRANFSDDEGSLTGYNEPPPDKVLEP